jgi:hypothetical protein
MLLPIFRFSEKGKIFAKQEIRAIQTGPGGLFFTGDGTGQVRVWNSVAVPTATTWWPFLFLCVIMYFSFSII